MPRNDLIQVRRDTAANWAAVNPVLAAGEQGLATDTGAEKIGDGVTAWNALPMRQSASYAPLPSGTPTVGQVPVVSTVSPLALGWGAGGGGGAASVPGTIPDLSRWYQKLSEARQGGPSPVMVYVGDSTSIGANTFIDILTYPYTRSGEALEGLTADTTHIVTGGNNGFAGAYWLTQTGSGIPSSNYFPQDVINLNPDLIILSFGINDVRTGTTSLAQLEAFLENVIAWRTTNLPNAGLVLRMPNSLLTVDATGVGYVVPNSSAQAYTDIMYRAYSNIRQKYPDVAVVDLMTSVFGRTCRPISTYMNDQLHPNGTGYVAVVDEIVKVIGIPQYQTDQVDSVLPRKLRDLNKRALITLATVNNKSLTSNVATLTTTAAHTLKVGQVVAVAIGDTVFDGVHTITTVPTTTTLTYAKTNADIASTAVTTAAVIRRGPSWAENPSVLDSRGSHSLVLELNPSTIDTANNRIITGPLDGGINNDAALVGIVQAGDIVRLGENWVARPGGLSLTYSGSAGLLNGNPGWLATAPTNSRRVRVYRPVGEMDERIEYAWRLGNTRYGFVRMFTIIAGTNGTVTVQKDTQNVGLRPANECYFDAADKMYIPGDATSQGRTFTVSVRQGTGGNITFAVAGVDFTNLVGKPIVIVGDHDPETGRRRSATVDPPSIAAGETADIDVTITGLDPNVHHLNWQPPALTAGLVISFVRVKATDTATIRLYNSTASPIDEPSATWAFWLMR